MYDTAARGASNNPWRSKGYRDLVRRQLRARRNQFASAHYRERMQRELDIWTRTYGSEVEQEMHARRVALDQRERALSR